MEKIIHYCWFGGKPLPKLAKKCVKSWKKYLPDYKIMKWNESNFDVKVCPFVEQAYESKKWAFVSDYARLYALYKHGGIYFDTDMEVIKNIDHLLDKEFFIGNEANYNIAAGVIGVKEKENKYVKELMEFYEKQQEFNINMIYNYAIPKVITKTFEKYKREEIEKGIEILDGAIYVYPEEFFYPINYDYSKRNYTENTCMVHYYNADWIPKRERRVVKMYRTFGKKRGDKIYKVLYFGSRIKNTIKSKIQSTVYKAKKVLSICLNQNKRVKKAKELLQSQNGEYIVIHHPDWLGISNATKDAFSYLFPLHDQYITKEAEKTAKAIIESGKKLVIFNGFANGWNKVAKELRRLKSDLIIKVLWHGSNALLSEGYDWKVFIQILELYRTGVINEIGFVKKSMEEFYRKIGYRTSFVMNTVVIENAEQYKQERKDNSLHVGLYSSGDRWVKNTYNQLSAISLLENATMDCVPLGPKVIDLAGRFKLDITGEMRTVTREEMFKRIASNDINVYVTFTECAPLIPLESLELGVPCVTGDNHHYFEGTPLEEYLVVKKEDNIIEIYNQIQKVLENKDKIMELYKEWKKDYDPKAKESVEKFLKVD